jgi:GH24 family phage-related lysozyme (muramidase)
MKRMISFLLAVVLFAGLMVTGAPTVYAASEMKVSDALVEVLKQEEGFSAKPYWDYGQYTVGYGTRCPDDMLEEYKKNGISKEAAEILLRNYLSKTESTINKKFIDKYDLKLTQGQFDALVTFTYNCGSSWISETSGTFHNAVKKGKTGSELINAFSLWCSAGGQILPGLVRRRLSEANMFLNGKYSRSKPDNYCYVYCKEI